MTEVEWLKEEFDRCWPWLEPAIEVYGHTHEREHVWDTIQSGHAQLWPLPNGAVVMTVETHPTGIKEYQGWLAGGDLSEIKDLMPKLEQWGRENGCDRLLLFGRRGWLKAFPQYQERGTLMMRDL